MSGAAVQEDIDIAKLFDGIGDSLPCDFTDCENDGTHFLICGICKESHETMCTEHTADVIMVQTQYPEATIKFDQTCGHSPKFSECEIRPIG
jgi:hypothetical protein